MEYRNIEWTTHTFNPWIGCQHVSPGCDHCYAETMMDHSLSSCGVGAARKEKADELINIGSSHYAGPEMLGRVHNGLVSSVPR